MFQSKNTINALWLWQKPQLFLKTERDLWNFGTGVCVRDYSAVSRGKKWTLEDVRAGQHWLSFCLMAVRVGDPVCGTARACGNTLARLVWLCKAIWLYVLPKSWIFYFLGLSYHHKITKQISLKTRSKLKKYLILQSFRGISKKQSVLISFKRSSSPKTTVVLLGQHPGIKTH